ncbi:MAG: DUF6804 family protein [Candidatus Paceibacterota bacterium]|jgi:uncharacterized membrane protein
MQNWIKQNWFKIVAILFLLGAFWDWSYGYYQILRWVVCIVGIYSAYLANKNHGNTWIWIFGSIAVLFNPIIPFYLLKETWQILDIMATIIFFISLFYEHQRKK